MSLQWRPSQQPKQAPWNQAECVSPARRRGLFHNKNITVRQVLAIRKIERVIIFK